MSLNRISTDKELQPELDYEGYPISNLDLRILNPMECLQARLDYAHHKKHKANRKGSHADDEALCQAQMDRDTKYWLWVIGEINKSHREANNGCSKPATNLK